jgi:hypothetical protein
MNKRTLALMTALGAMLLTACGGSSSGSLSPARSLIGTWKDLVPVTFNFANAVCGTLFVSASVPLSDITWVVTSGISGDNSLLIEMTFTAGSPTLNQDSCPQGSNLQDPNLTSPMELFGTVSSSSLAVVDGSNTPAGTFNFTSSVITGTFSDALIDASNGQTTALESTASDALDLTLQH